MRFTVNNPLRVVLAAMDLGFFSTQGA